MPRINQPPTTFTPDQILRAVKGWCWDCGERCPNYVVDSKVWRAAWDDRDWLGSKKLLRLKQAATKHFPERARSIDSDLVHVHIHLCFGCIELRLKRHLRITDFTMLSAHDKPLAENAGIFLGYLMGYKAAMHESKKAAEAGNKKDEGG
jgi:hypothetical protein